MLINSDNCFSPDWLINLKKRLTPKNVVSPQIIQPRDLFNNPINKTTCHVIDYGSTLKTFNEELFLIKANELKQDSISDGCLFMPALLYKNIIEDAGYFPEGNLHNGSYNSIKMCGDHYFYEKLNKMGIKHINSNDSVVYHFNEGEKRSKI